MEDIILQYTYPRLDAEVSKHRNHLLKAPFCVHPKTGRVCVPVDPTRVATFNPEKVPTVAQLLRELDMFEKTKAKIAKEAAEKGDEAMVVDEDQKDQADWSKTSLRPYVEMLDSYGKSLVEDTNQLKLGKYGTCWRFAAEVLMLTPLGSQTKSGECWLPHR